MKIANDMRWLASGPRCGLGELMLAGERAGFLDHAGQGQPDPVRGHGDGLHPGASARTTAVAFAGSQGNFQLNAMRPIIINNFLHSARILADACGKFRRFSVEGTELNRTRIAEMLDRSLMLVTALAPVIGYDKAAHIAHEAHVHGQTLKEAALQSGAIDEATFDRVVDPRTMV